MYVDLPLPRSKSPVFLSTCWIVILNKATQNWFFNRRIVLKWIFFRRQLYGSFSYVVLCYYILICIICMIYMNGKWLHKYNILNTAISVRQVDISKAAGTHDREEEGSRGGTNALQKSHCTAPLHWKQRSLPVQPAQKVCTLYSNHNIGSEHTNCVAMFCLFRRFVSHVSTVLFY